MVRRLVSLLVCLGIAINAYAGCNRFQQLLGLCKEQPESHQQTIQPEEDKDYPKEEFNCPYTKMLEGRWGLILAGNVTSQDITIKQLKCNKKIVFNVPDGPSVNGTLDGDRLHINGFAGQCIIVGGQQIPGTFLGKKATITFPPALIDCGNARFVRIWE